MAWAKSSHVIPAHDALQSGVGPGSDAVGCAVGVASCRRAPLPALVCEDFATSLPQQPVALFVMFCRRPSRRRLPKYPRTHGHPSSSQRKPRRRDPWRAPTASATADRTQQSAPRTLTTTQCPSVSPSSEGSGRRSPRRADRCPATPRPLLAHYTGRPRRWQLAADKRGACTRAARLRTRQHR